MRYFIFACLWAGLSAGATAQDLNPRYTVIGTGTAHIGDATHMLIVPYDTEKDRARAKESNFGMGRSFSVSLHTVGAEGKPGSPFLQLTFQISKGQPDWVTAEFFDAQGISAPLAAGPDAGTVAFTAFDISADNQVTASLAGTFLRLKDYTTAPAIADSAAPVPFTAEIMVNVPKP